ncbi:hypothetical protein [Fulvivirga sediminis]|uniref:Uncharacterized protein n=1 Tax=Fulvivirga sediminis TaxID=2803949 RepID=A0A937F7M1_9BACT|nr:hypothetical protein [Fulvivirga sediminis]MBL3657917.1 hypothetical protein [Fulvivirga sediminis]
MSAIDTFLFNTPVYTKEQVFDDIKARYKGNERIAFKTDANPFTKEENLKLIIDDGASVITVLHAADAQVADDFEFLSDNATVKPTSFMRLIMNDQNNDYDDITVDLYDFVSSLSTACCYAHGSKKWVHKTTE